MTRAGWLCILAAALAGFLAGRWSLQERPQPITPAAAVRLDSGALMLERTPEEPPPQVKTELPDGATLRRVVSIQVQPRNLEPITVNLSLVDTPNGPRAIADAPEATITGGMDYPNPEPRRNDPRWAVGPSVGYESGKARLGLAATYSGRRWTVGTVANCNSFYGFVAIRF